MNNDAQSLIYLTRPLISHFIKSIASKNNVKLETTVQYWKMNLDLERLTEILEHPQILLKALRYPWPCRHYL